MDTALATKEIPLNTGDMDVDESNRYLLIGTHPTLEDIYVLQELLSRMAERCQFVVKHYWINGVYAREMLIPKGSCLVGKMHAHDQIIVIPKGDISVMTEDGMIRVKAPYTGVSKAGVKRAGYAHEDTIFMTFHANPDDCREVEALEDWLTAPIDKPARTLEKPA